MKMSHRSIPLLLFLFFLLSGPDETPAELDSAKIRFIDTLNLQMLEDYRLCTGDSAEVDVYDLLKWRESIDSVITSGNYGTIAKKYFEETGLSPANVRPCEIVGWMRGLERQMLEYSGVLDSSREMILKKREDSLYLARELAANPAAPYDLLRLPFGISRRAFTISMRTRRAGVATEGKQFIRYDSVPYGVQAFRVAFHFSRDDKYESYEIESNSSHYDSLNTRIRPKMLYMATLFQTTVNTPPDHIYRVGQFDIVPGRLAICKLWNFPRAVAYFGLARNKTRFYAKAIVTRKK